MTDYTNVVEFPAYRVRLAQATRAYKEELARFDRLECEGKHPRFNQVIKQTYFAARREAGWGFPAYTATPDETAR